MPKIDYRIDRIRVIGKGAFSEASKEELRALLALIELGGVAESVEELANAAKISSARCKAALAFWEESEVIFQCSDRPIIISEFEDRLVASEIDEVPAREVADSIRDEQLASMIDECGRMMGQACLSNTDVKNITALHTQYLLGADYIVTLAAYLSSKGELSIRKLCNEAIKLSGRGCNSMEALEAYITEMETGSGAEWEFRRVIGIYGRNLSTSERAYFKKWSEEFGYSVSIVSEAYDIAVLNTKSGRGDLRYMDSVLTAWHNAGCRTVSDCREQIEKDKLKRQAEQTQGEKKRQKTIPKTPRYGNFDINEAFNNAVARSFGSEDTEGEVK